MSAPSSGTSELPVLVEANSSDSLALRQVRVLRRQHWSMLIGCAVVLCLAFALRFGEEERVTFGNLRLPPMCASRAVFKVDCPGCGLTRSFVLLAQGEWQAAWKMHRVGWVLALAMLAQFPYRIAGLRSETGRPLGRLFPTLFGYLLIALLIGNWLLLQIPSSAP